MLEVLGNFVFYPLAIALAVAIPILLLLYLLKKKVTTTYLPSMMFLLKEQGKKRFKWFPRIPINWMLLIHLLLLILLILAVMEPFVQIPESLSQEHTYILIDNSASMQTAGRFAQAKSDAINALGLKNSIILTSPTTQILLQDANYLQARNAISQLQPTEAPSSLLENLQYIHNQQFTAGTLHIFSDFTNVESLALAESFARLSSFVLVTHEYTQGSNAVGFINVEVSAQNTTFLVKNFQPIPQQITIQIGNAREQLTIPANDVIPVSIDHPISPTAVTLLPLDDFAVDNVLYLVPEQKLTKSAVYYTNRPSLYTQTALSVIDYVEYTTHQPPGYVSADTFDIFVFENVDLDKILPSNIEEALEKVAKGGVMIIKTSERMPRFIDNPAFPFSTIHQKRTSEIGFVASDLTKLLTASSSEQVFPITTRPGAIPLITDANDDVISAYIPHGQGIIMYYGINDEYYESRFSRSYAYPILFSRIFKEVFQIPELFETHLKTGETLLGTGSLHTKSGVKQLPFILEHTGDLQKDGINYAINHLNIDESLVSEHADLSIAAHLFTPQTVPKSITPVLAVLITILLLVELLYLRRRGDFA